MPKLLRAVDWSHAGVGFTAIALAAVLWAIAATLEPLAAAIFAWIGLGQTYQSSKLREKCWF